MTIVNIIKSTVNLSSSYCCLMLMWFVWDSLEIKVYVRNGDLSCLSNKHTVHTYNFLNENNENWEKFLVEIRTYIFYLNILQKFYMEILNKHETKVTFQSKTFESHA